MPLSLLAGTQERLWQKIRRDWVLNKGNEPNDGAGRGKDTLITCGCGAGGEQQTPTPPIPGERGPAFQVTSPACLWPQFWAAPCL